MMYDRDEVQNQNSDPNQGGSQQTSENPQQIAEDIARTRNEMGETVDAIEERLSPQRLKEEAKQTVREQTVGRAKRAANRIELQAKPLISKAQQQIQPVVARAQTLRKENPRLFKAAVVGLPAVLTIAALVSALRAKRKERRRRAVPVLVGYIGTLRRQGMRRQRSK